MSDAQIAAIKEISKPDKAVYRTAPDTFMYGRPGEFAPRVKRVKEHGKYASYRRTKGGTIPTTATVLKDTRVPRALYTALRDAEKVGEA